ncbi:hypothetical protein NEHOM01_2298 [Nematocida homosporus]|uniref:uncharacterized protein n=1 Tax=Nematocida homosporus TaxID=1912981 RepID=UPI002220C11E|nr:uncharacterized protein NEHOM01_2298 [Nematocida homosporus]KAI5187594.1 hypothetical protein NEHOM01_2298 [Nematocida homosporus]
MASMRCVYICTLLWVLYVNCREAQYHDQDFDVNLPGYLYSLGARKYVGIDPVGKTRLIVIDNPNKAIKLRTYLSGVSAYPGLVFMEDNGTWPDDRAGYLPVSQDLANKRILEACPDIGLGKIIVSPYNAGIHTRFTVTPPILLNENAFQVIGGRYCLTVDKDSSMITLAACAPAGSRQLTQLFSWVNKNDFNRGKDPITYQPNPDLYVSKITPDQQEGILRRLCSRYKPVRMDVSGLSSPTNLPYPDPYLHYNTAGDVPRYCRGYLLRNDPTFVD